jgi:hypothetical protein
MTLNEKRQELGIEEIHWHGPNTGLSDDELLEIELKIQVEYNEKNNRN